MNFKILAAAAALCASQAFAIIGVGFHYAPGFGTSLKGAPEHAPVAKVKAPGPDGNDVTTSIDFSHEDFSGMMQGFGLKLWVDVLPIFDVEATVNVQFGSYDASLWVEKTEIPLEIELGGTPFGKANPKFVVMNGDFSITYPITFIPVIRPYIGGGLTYYMNSFVLNQGFVEGVVGNVAADIQDIVKADEITPDMTADDIEQMKQAKLQKLKDAGEKLKQNVQDKAVDEGLKTSIGGHILVGMRAKLPVIPIAAYANYKYYLGGDFAKEIDFGRHAVEVGIGLAI